MLNVRAMHNLVPSLHTSSWYLVRLAFDSWRSRLGLEPVVPTEWYETSIRSIRLTL